MPCTVNSVCYQHRGQIVQDEETVTLTEKIYNKGRAWYIRPTKTPTNALLAFKVIINMLVLIKLPKIGSNNT